MENKGFEITDLFSFDKMVSPIVLKIVYWLGLIGIGLYLLVALYGALEIMRFSFATGIGTVVGAILGALIGALFWRILIEVYMIFFGIHDKVSKIHDMMADKNSGE